MSYVAGTVGGTVTIPVGSYLQRVALIPAGSGATLTIGGGGAITLHSNEGFDERYGVKVIDSDVNVVLAGTISTWYVSWQGFPNINT